MAQKWLGIFFRFSGFVFHLKRKMAESDSSLKVMVYAVVLIFLELIFSILSLPMYFFLSPKKLREKGFFPTSLAKENVVGVYSLRRKISVTTFFSAGGVFLIKLIFIGIVSMYLTGAQVLLAVTQDWTFTNAGDYAYDSGKIEFTGGVARLKDQSSVPSGSTTNSGFTSDATGWTYYDWDQGGGEVNIAGSYQATGGNPSGHVRISAPNGKDDELGGYWEQPFTTTVANPTVNVNFDWLVSAYVASPISFKMLVYVDSASGAPTLGQEVWSSGEITSTQSWTSVTNVNASSKVTTAGTYYLKVAVWLETPGTNKGPYTIGYDNAILSWYGSVPPSYATDRPTVKPNTSLNPTVVSSWDSFTESATKNGGEIYYQLSDDDGSNWYYWSGTEWSIAGGSNYNTASVINTNINTFSTANKKIMWQAFLESDGTEQVILDNISISYTENDLPDVLNLNPTQSTTDIGTVLVNYNLQDAESDASSLTAYEYSLTGAFSGEEAVMTASSTHPNHEGTTGLTTSPGGTAHIFVWDAKTDLGNTYNGAVYVRMRGNDGAGDGNYTLSSSFPVDIVNAVVSNVSASQTLGTTNVSVTYDLTDNTSNNIFVELDISEDSGATWLVVDSSVSGDVGAGVSSGNGKVMTWNVGTDFDNQEQSDLQVRVRAKDAFQNQGNDVASLDFAIDTVNPTANGVADLKAQPNAGDATVLVGGSFTENNPNTNNFYIELNDGGYGSATAGDSDTVTPSDQATNVGVSLDGNDVISKVKIVHADDYGQAVDNENTSPAVAYKYVKPFTPDAPLLSNPITTQLDITLNPHDSETSGLEYIIEETTTGKYVQGDGTLGNSPVWQTDSVWGTKTVTGLSSPVSQYIFRVKSRNPNDLDHAETSESAYSATSQITNTAPSISFGGISQTTDGTRYVPVNYTGTDGQGDINSIIAYEYSVDGTNWYTMTEKSDVGSDGITNLVFLPGGSAHDFMWDSGTNVSGVEDSSVYVRLRSNDSIVNSTLVTSGAFEVDNVIPVVSNVSASQNVGAKTVTVTYDLADANNSLVEIDISEDGGSTWNVADTSVSGSVGSGITPGNGKTIIWNAGVDFNGQYQNDIRVRVRVKDSYGNQGNNSESSNFTIDTHAPVVTNVTAIQDSGAKTFTFHYDVTEDIGNVDITLQISHNGGTTWNVPITTASGDFGSGITPDNGKIITWNAGTDYNGYEEGDMQVRITAEDSYTNSGNLNSSNFNLDTLAPRITFVGATQSSGSTDVSITYNLADISTSLVEIDISEDGGGSWTVTDTSVTGDVGSGITSGNGKTITWNAGTDFDNQEQSDLQVRVRAKDVYESQGNDVASSNFAIDTVNPTVNVTADLKAQPNAGDTTVLIGGSFNETNPNTNNFYGEINNGGYGSATAGSANTASPSDKATEVGTGLDGNDVVSKVKIVHTDDHGQTVDNENTSPAVVYKYVKPYTPLAPTVYNPTVGTVDVIINPHASEASVLEYVIYETTQGKYVQANGTLGDAPVWKTRGTESGQWGETTGVIGKITVTGLVNDSYTYEFKAKSRNTSDTSHAVSSESAFSGGASSQNQSPIISLDSVAQTTDGTRYVVINYTGSDLESESSNLITVEYSTNNTNWYTMTEKSGVGSDGTSGLAFIAGGTSHDFMWDVGADLINAEDNTVYVRLQAFDGTSSGAIVTSSAFPIDTKNPVISSVVGLQVLNTNTVNFTYNLTDLNSSNIEMDISEDGGSTWNVTDTSVIGDIGANIAPGSGKNIIWNAGNDFDNQDQTDMRVEIRATDAFGNQGTYGESANFDLDTANPSVTNVSASQNAGTNTVDITYDLSDSNDSFVEIDISEDGGGTWNVTDTSVTGDVGADIAPGVGQSIAWNAGVDFSGQDQNDIRVRVRATDVYTNESGNVESGNFPLDTLGPVIASVFASQTLGTENVVITYNLTDSNPVDVEIDISEDNGSTWNVTDTSVTGDVGLAVAPGNGKTITWNAGINFPNEDQNDILVRVRGSDSNTNSSGNIESSNFLVDTLDPVINSGIDLYAQPDAGDNAVFLGGSFIETNPNTNNFSVALNGGAYGSETAGDSNTANPANQVVSVETTLDGNDFISKAKIVHTDDYGHSVNNEDLSLSTVYKYVKPYTPQAPTVNNPQNSSVDVTINPHTSEVIGLEYSIYESTTGKYVQTAGTLGTNAVWRTTASWGTVTITGLTSPVSQYTFQVKSRNTSDPLDQLTSESNLSSSAGIPNTSPVITVTSVVQQTGGVNYVLVNYTGVDGENDTNDITSFEYSTDALNWFPMTEKSGVGSDGITDLLFSTLGTSLTFAWDSATDLPGIEDSTVYVRLQSSDTLANSNMAQSSAFDIDNTGPTIQNISVSQTAGTDTLVIEYDLVDNTASGIAIEALISENSGTTWTVPITTLAGDIGVGVTAGVNKNMTWNAGIDFNNEEQTDMRVEIRGTDSYGNAGIFTESADFFVDTSAPSVTNVTALQTTDTNNVVITYDLDDVIVGGHFVELEVSENSGVTWDIVASSVTGDVGSGVTVGVGKSIVWNAGVDFNAEEQGDMRVRVRAKDYFNHQGTYSSSPIFTLDTKDPILNNISVLQTGGTDNVVVTYDVSDNAGTVLVEMDISDDGGSTWNVADTTVTGDIGVGVATGNNKTITWNAGNDYGNQEQADMRVRIRAKDSYANQSINYESTDFALDTGAPLGLLSISKFTGTNTQVTLNWSSGVTDANFDHYEIWHGTNQADVQGRIGTALQWDMVDDPNLTNVNSISTVITGLNITGKYYVKIWAVDKYGNETTLGDINIYEAPVVEVEQVVSGGGGSPISLADITPPNAPILAPILSPTNGIRVLVSGLAEPRSKIDLYDNNEFIGRLTSTVDGSGRFSQSFTFGEGEHILTAIAEDFTNNRSSASSPLAFAVDLTSPEVPTVLSYENGETITDTTPLLVGLSEANGTLEIRVDGEPFEVQVDQSGTWNFTLPNTFALDEGTHTVTFRTEDTAGNLSNEFGLDLNVVPSLAPVQEGGVSPVISIPLETVTPEVIEAVEIPSLERPEVTNLETRVENDTFSFSGVALPNQDVIVYINSERTLVYRTVSDENGIWNVNHSQDNVELQPGEHTVFAVSVDKKAKVKTAPGAMSMFTVEKSFWVTLFRYLNIYTTTVTIFVLALTMVWLYRMKRVQEEVLVR